MATDDPLWAEARTAQYRADEFERALREIAMMELDDQHDAAANNMRDLARAALGLPEAPSANWPLLSTSASRDVVE